MKDAVDLLNDQLTAALNENRRLRAAIERMSGCDGCDCEWQANNVPQTIAARVIVRHMETQHGAGS